MIRFLKAMHSLLRYIRTELEADTGKPYSSVFDEIWQVYETQMLERFPYIELTPVLRTGITVIS